MVGRLQTAQTRMPVGCPTCRAPLPIVILADAAVSTREVLPGVPTIRIVFVERGPGCNERLRTGLATCGAGIP